MNALSKRPPPMPKSSPSGKHPAVVEYRKKLDSVAETGVELDSLDQAIQKYLEEVKTPIPPKP